MIFLGVSEKVNLVYYYKERKRWWIYLTSKGNIITLLSVGLLVETIALNMCFTSLVLEWIGWPHSLTGRDRWFWSKVTNSEENGLIVKLKKISYMVPLSMPFSFLSQFLGKTRVKIIIYLLSLETRFERHTWLLLGCCHTPEFHAIVCLFWHYPSNIKNENGINTNSNNVSNESFLFIVIYSYTVLFFHYNHRI